MANKYAQASESVQAWETLTWYNAVSGGNPTTAPASTDVAYINLGATVTLNTEYIATVDLGGLVVNGTLNCCTTAKASLKVSADITGSGTINCGGYTTGALDVTKTLATNLVMTFDFDGTAKGFNSVNLALNFYCWNPTNQFAKLVGDETTADASLLVDRSVLEWKTFYDAAGLTPKVYVCDVPTLGASPHDLHASTGIDAAGTTITLSANLAANKAAGSYVALITRNIRAGNTTGYVVNACKTGSVLGLEISLALGGASINGIGSGINLLISGTISGCGSAISTSSNYLIGFTVTGIIAGCTTGINTGAGFSVSGVIVGCTQGVSGAEGIYVSGIIAGCNAGVQRSSVYFKNATLKNATDVYYSLVEAYNTTFDGVTTNATYIYLPYSYSKSIDHNGIGGNFKAWSGGGFVQSTVAVDDVPPGFSHGYGHFCKDVRYPCPRREEMRVGPGKTLHVRGYFKLTTPFDIAPKLELLKLDGTSLGVGTSAAVADVDDIENWQQVDVSWTNDATYEQTVLIQASGQHASNDFYETWEIWPFVNIESYSDPLSMVYNELWSMLEEDADFIDLVSPGNRIKFSGTNRSPEKDETNTADYPEVRIVAITSTPHPGRTSNGSSLVKQFAIQVLTGDQRLDAVQFPLEWIIYKALARSHARLIALKWNNKDFVKTVKPTTVRDSMAYDNLLKPGVHGWISVWSCDVEMWFSTADM